MGETDERGRLCQKNGPSITENRRSLISNTIYFVSVNVGFTALRLDSLYIYIYTIYSESLTSILVFIQKFGLEISMYFEDRRLRKC